MKTVRFCQTAGLPAATALRMPEAQAAAPAASWTGVYLQVFDLNPLEGIAAGISFDFDGIQGNGWASHSPPDHSFSAAAGGSGAGNAGSGAAWSNAAVAAGDRRTGGSGPNVDGRRRPDGRRPAGSGLHGSAAWRR